jgi:hypothetical protein
LTFTKQEAAAAVFITYYDNFRVTSLGSGGGAVAADWEILINGERCSSPAPLIHTVYNGDGQNQHNPATVTGLCTATASGVLGAGSITLTVTATTPFSGGSCYTGYGLGAGLLQAEELN